MGRCHCAILFLFLITGSGFAGTFDSPPPSWIWSKEDSAKVFQIRTTVPAKSKGNQFCTLYLVADFCRARVTVEGRPVAIVEPYDPPLELSLVPFLGDGESSLVLELEAADGPSAVAASLATKNLEGQVSFLITGKDGDWTCESPFVSFGEVSPQRWGPNHLLEISAFSEYNQWKEAETGGEESTSIENITKIPPGFTIERLRAAGPEEDSWVSLEIDSEGRLLVAKEQKGILRMTRDADGQITSVESVEDTLKECRGLYEVDGVLFADANRSKALYRLEDKDGDGHFEETALLQTTEGSTGHGRNDLAPGPGDRISIIQGDSVDVPEGALLRPAREPGGDKELGHWTQTTNTGKPWEILCRGLRNPYGIAFNRDGEAFTFDADNEGDVGLPFYRPTRINHLVSGANYGWHQYQGNTRSFPVYAPDSVPTTYDVGRGSPTAVKFGYHGSFPAQYRNALFALDWAYGRIIAIHLTPLGSSYEATGETFLEGRPLNVTDLDFDENGDMLFITGGRKTQSALYRVRCNGEPIKAGAPPSQKTRREKFSKEARSLRKSLEAFHGQVDSSAVEAAWPHLDSEDPWIRNAARVALEWQPSDQWSDRINGTSLADLTALLALQRQGDPSASAKKLTTFLEADTTGWNRTEKLTLLRACEWALIRNDGITPALQALQIEKLSSWPKDVHFEVNRELSRVLCLLDAPGAAKRTLKLLAESDDQKRRLHFFECLSYLKDSPSAEERTQFFLQLGEAKRQSAGDRFMPAFFEEMEKRALESVTDPAEKEEYSRHLLDKPLYMPPPAKERNFEKNWTLGDFEADVVAKQLQDADTAAGRQLFDAVLCSHCHVCGVVGRAVGPDLTQVSARFSPLDILESIIEPSQVVSEAHRNMIITRNDGSVVTGRVVWNDFRQSTLHVSENPFDPLTLTPIPKAKIKSQEESPVSPMPPGLINTLSREEITNLLAWISTGGKTNEK